MPDDDIEFPVPLTTFIASLKSTPDEVWGRLLKSAHAIEKRTMAGWARLLDGYRSRRA